MYTSLLYKLFVNFCLPVFHNQDQIDNGIPISLCLRKFYRWLEQQQQEKGFYLFGSAYKTSAKGLNVAAFVTWSGECAPFIILH